MVVEGRPAELRIARTEAAAASTSVLAVNGLEEGAVADQVAHAHAAAHQVVNYKETEIIAC